MGTAEETFNGGSGWESVGCDQEGSQARRGSFVTTLSADEGNENPAVQQAAQVVIAQTQVWIFL